jgi:hypothetical protein
MRNLGKNFNDNQFRSLPVWWEAPTPGVYFRTSRNLKVTQLYLLMLPMLGGAWDRVSMGLWQLHCSADYCPQWMSTAHNGSQQITMVSPRLALAYYGYNGSKLPKLDLNGSQPLSGSTRFITKIPKNINTVPVLYCKVKKKIHKITNKQSHEDTKSFTIFHGQRKISSKF